MFKKSLATSCAVAAALGATGWGIARADVPMPTVGGKVYADITNLDETSDGAKTAASGTGADVKRFYLIFNEKFNDLWSAKLETDATYNSGQQVDVYMKNAWLQATLSQAFWVRLGESDMPWIPFDEGIYGNRYIENTLIDRLHFGNSADWGLHIGGDLAGKALSYQISVVNGAGYKNPTRSKSMDVAGRVDYQVAGFVFALGGYSGKLGDDTYGTGAATTYHTADRFDALAAYKGYGLTVGLEYFSANDWTTVLKATSDKADGYSAFAQYDFSPMWNVFGRWDTAKTSKDLAPNLKDQYFNVGVDMKPIKNVDVALVYKHEKVDGGGFINTSYGKIGGTTDGKVDEIGIWTQVAF
jgi:hypothetical protein